MCSANLNIVGWCVTLMTDAYGCGGVCEGDVCGVGEGTRHWPQGISHQPSAISHQPSAISHQPPAAGLSVQEIRSFVPPRAPRGGGTRSVTEGCLGICVRLAEDPSDLGLRPSPPPREGAGRDKSVPPACCVRHLPCLLRRWWICDTAGTRVTGTRGNRRLLSGLIWGWWLVGHML